ncbi:MAG: transaldolase [Saprospiraceae bacterium]|jgi:transaldolase|nr:transaldolase [Saprospiraceae bacterium]MBL0294552.1 transaldolase [Saprospiraceae bacterium]
MKNFNVKIFADGAEKSGMLEMNQNSLISGLTTNPTLMKKAGIIDYRSFCKDILLEIKTKPLSLEVFADDLQEMERQALEISTWADNVYVKIPVMNTKQQSTLEICKKLTMQGVKLNVTAMMTFDQVKDFTPYLNLGNGANVSVFAGRIADTGIDPLPLMKKIVTYLQDYPKVELIWASPREVLNVYQADEIGCHIITVTNDIIKKLNLYGKDLNQYSLETVEMFYNDALAAGFKL